MGIFKKLLKVLAVAAVVPVVAFAVQKDNPRGTVAARGQDVGANATTKKTVSSVVSRSVSKTDSQKRTVVNTRSEQNQNVKARAARSGNVARTATKSTVARSGTTTAKKTSPNTSRAGVARATAVFNDVSKVGGGYAACRDAYATCMDQICANANDTYRRCFCSDRFTNFRETSDRFDSVLNMLAEFQDNNLEAVDKTAAEVNAMYTATAGESVIKNDTSAAQKLLDSINDILSGKTSAQTQKQSLVSLGVLDFSSFDDTTDIWGDDTFSIFGEGASSNISELEGKALYNSANKQCSQLIKDSCASDTMFNLAKSSYSIMITQDCNVVEKSINAKRASVEETVRTAEKYLREARLEEYRAHNTQDVNECLERVDAAMQRPNACGENYIKCMDLNTGLYINNSTGDAILSPALFELNKLIVLKGNTDVLTANPKYDKYLDTKKEFAESALDTCRNLSETVWKEFKRSALIRIAQAQDEKIQEVKDSCVMTVKECYDTNTGALKDIDDTEMQATGAIAAVAARGSCYDKVMACAALYGDPDGCVYDDATKTLKNNGTKDCGLQSLLVFVDTVDSVKVAEGCETALLKRAHELCDPRIDEDGEYPDRCITMPKSELYAQMDTWRKTFCVSELVQGDNSNTIQDQDRFSVDLMNQIIKDIYDDLGLVFMSACEEDYGGVWVPVERISAPALSLLVSDFYDTYYGTGTITNINQISGLTLSAVGWCMNEDNTAACEELGDDYCNSIDNDGSPQLTEQWYSDYCSVLGGSWNWQYETCRINP